MEPMTEYSARIGRSPAQARVDTRLSAAVVRGLLLDLLGSGDRAAADEAFGRFVELCRAVLEGGASAGPGG